MKLLRIPKLPKFKLTRSRKQPPQKLEARLRASSATAVDAYDDEEPPAKLTGALIVVALLHVVAVGGIYAFNQIKASRRGTEPDLQPPAKTVSQQQAAPVPVVQQPNQPKPVASQPAPSVAPAAPILKQRVYNVKLGDTLTGIATSLNVTVADLKAANSMGSDSIRIGQVLNLPAAKSPAETPVVAAKPVEHSDAKVSTKTYTVKSGDRLIFIAKKFGVSQEDLVAFNRIKDPAKLQIGQTIKIPAKKTN